MASAARLLWPLPSFLLELKFSENLVSQLFFSLGILHKCDQELTGPATTPPLPTSFRGSLDKGQRPIRRLRWLAQVHNRVLLGEEDSTATAGRPKGGRCTVTPLELVRVPLTCSIHLLDASKGLVKNGVMTDTAAVEA